MKTPLKEMKPIAQFLMGTAFSIAVFVLALIVDALTFALRSPNARLEPLVVVFAFSVIISTSFLMLLAMGLLIKRLYWVAFGVFLIDVVPFVYMVSVLDWLSKGAH